MTRLRDEPVDDRLRQLLAIEQRLQERVRAAEADATRRIADARLHSEHIRAEAQLLQARADEEQAQADAAAHAVALTTIQHEHEAVMRAIADVSDERIDQLARRVIDRTIGGDGG